MREEEKYVHKKNILKSFSFRQRGIYEKKTKFPTLTLKKTLTIKNLTKSVMMKKMKQLQLGKEKNFRKEEKKSKK